MEKTGNRGGLKLVLGIIILIAAIVCLVVALSSCGSDDSGKDVAEKPPVSDKADDGDTADDPAEDSEPATNNGSGSGNGGSTAGGNNNTGAADNAPTENGGASLEEWINYLKNYDDNVENGVEGATDDFTDMIDQVGDKMENGNYGEGFDQFGTGLKDYLGGLAGSLTP